MTKIPFRFALAAGLAGALFAGLLPGASAHLKIQNVTVAKVPAWNPYWVYGIDMDFNAMTAGVIQIYDARHDHFIGQLDSGFSLDGMAVSPDHNTIYAPGIYYSRGTRGTRTDVVDVFDRKTLDHIGEISIPAKHAQSVPTAQDTTLSADGKLLYVSNITPATSISVVDTATRRFIGEVNTSACVQAYPYGRYDFFSMCPDSSILQVALDANGKEVGRSKSKPFFDVDKDPVFVNGLKMGNEYLFISFDGKVHAVVLDGLKSQFPKVWSLVSPGEAAANWRPGGFQVGALNTRTGRLYVLMHQGSMGSHKAPGEQVWVYDLKTHALLRKLELAPAFKRQGLQPLLGIQVSQTAHEVLLYGFTTDSNLVIMDAHDGAIRHVAKPFGATTLQLMNP